MESELEKIRQERYDGVTKSDMIRDLITRGLNTLATDRRGEKEQREVKFLYSKIIYFTNIILDNKNVTFLESNVTFYNLQGKKQNSMSNDD